MKIGFALAIALAAAPAFGADATLKSLVVQAKQVSQGRVMLLSRGADSQEGTLTEIGADVFCVDLSTLAGKRLERCFPYSSIEAINRPAPGDAKPFTSIWVSAGL